MARARALKDWEIGTFVIYHDDQLVARAAHMSDIDAALRATQQQSGSIPNIYISNLDDAGARWFHAWAATTGERRDLRVRINASNGKWVTIHETFVTKERPIEGLYELALEGVTLASSEPDD